MTDRRIYQIGLTMINGVGDILSRHLLQTLGDVEAVFTEKQQLLAKIQGIGPVLAAEIGRVEVLRRAEKELAFVEKNHISTYFIEEERYPKRLKECPDSPVLFYFKGDTNLDAARIVSIVGTRQATDYGREQTDRLIEGLSAAIPNLLIVSGLAYGIDVCAHRSALAHHLPTVGVMAHGLDRIYPPTHRNLAIEMLQHGGLLTDFPSETNPDKPNFVRRNRIVAGMADTTVVIESSEKGGSLITADIAFSYGRDVYTFPGRVTDPHSKGCNDLIKQNKAGLIASATDLISAMCWDVDCKSHPPIQTQLSFAELENEHPVVTLIRRNKEMHINDMAAILGMPVYELSSVLFELEMSGLVKVTPGNVYKLKRR